VTTAPVSPVRQALPLHTTPPNYVPASVGTTVWGSLPCAADAPVLAIEPGATTTFDIVSHEGILVAR
jgi:hypothetical protein